MSTSTCNAPTVTVAGEPDKLNQRRPTIYVPALPRSATRQWMRRSRGALILLLVSALALLSSTAARAATTLTVTPITWNTVGLDSNSATTGPYRVPVGGMWARSS